MQEADHKLQVTRGFYPLEISDTRLHRLSVNAIEPIAPPLPSPHLTHRGQGQYVSSEYDFDPEENIVQHPYAILFDSTPICSSAFCCFCNTMPQSDSPAALAEQSHCRHTGWMR